MRDFDARANSWRLTFVAGIVIGAFLASTLLSSSPVEMLPESYYTGAGVLRLAIGGVLVGFGVRYAGGCTSGHTITGIANLQWPSVAASIAFFLGGLAMVHLFQF